MKFKDDLIDEALTLTQVLSINSASSTTVDLSHAAWRSWASAATTICTRQKTEYPTICTLILLLVRRAFP